MTATMRTPDEELAQDIKRIRQEYPYHGNYRPQMAALLGVLFFKYGERVGANRLAALLSEHGKSPSTSTAQDEINKFWLTVRKNASVKLNRPDLPPALLDLFANMAGTAWEQSMLQAESHYQSHRQELNAQVLEAERQKTYAQEQLVLAQAGAEQILQKLALAVETQSLLKQQIATEQALRNELEATNQRLAQNLAALEQSRIKEAEQLQSTLSQMHKELTVAANEQRRLLAIGDDYKQQAARDRELRIKTESALSQLQLQIDQYREKLTQLVHEQGVTKGLLSSQESQLATLTNKQQPPQTSKSFRSIVRKSLSHRKANR